MSSMREDALYTAGRATDVGTFLDAVVFGLVYVGDQIARLADHAERQTAPAGRVPVLTFGEMMPSIREQAVESLRAEHVDPPHRLDSRIAIVNAVLRVADMIVTSNGGARVGETT